LLIYFLFYTHTYTHTHTRARVCTYTVSIELLSTELVLLFPAYLFVNNV